MKEEHKVDFYHKTDSINHVLADERVAEDKKNNIKYIIAMSVKISKNKPVKRKITRMKVNNYGLLLSIIASQTICLFRLIPPVEFIVL